MSDYDLFDAEESERLKRLGMGAAAGHRSSQLKLARGIAAALGKKLGKVSADDVGRVLKTDFNISSLGPAAGSLFKTNEWRWTGEWKKSSRITNHSRMIRVWEYIW